MIVRFRFSYDFKPNKIQIGKLNKILSEVINLDDKGGIDNNWNLSADINKLLDITPKIEIVEVLTPTLLQALQKTLDEIVSKMSTLNYSKDQELNTRCNIHISNIGLLSINQVLLQEDCCTKDISACLEKGWRIIAICPQPNQRRPDYIFGRQNID